MYIELKKDQISVENFVLHIHFLGGDSACRCALQDAFQDTTAKLGLFQHEKPEEYAEQREKKFPFFVPDDMDYKTWIVHEAVRLMFYIIALEPQEKVRQKDDTNRERFVAFYYQ